MKMGWYSRAGCLAFCVLWLFSCLTPYSTPKREPPSTTFPGLVELAAGVPGGGVLEVLSVHGMCTHDSKWVESTAREFGVFLGLEPLGSRQVDEVEGIELWLTDLADTGGNVVLRNYAIVWSPLTAAAKKTLCYDVSRPNGSCPASEFDGERASLNSIVKSGLLNDCFADAIVYLGPRGDRIRASMRAAIGAVGQQRAAANPLVLITESLGSKVVTDAILGGTAGERIQLLGALRNTRVIFMVANQIPLLNLGYQGNVRITEPPATLLDLRRAIRRSRLSEDRTLSDVYIVAFSDPNDLFTYELAIPTDRTTVNVRVSNAKTWFGWVENPDTAHRGYLDNREVWRLISCGHPDTCP